MNYCGLYSWFFLIFDSYFGWNFELNLVYIDSITQSKLLGKELCEIREFRVENTKVKLGSTNGVISLRSLKRGLWIMGSGKCNSHSTPILSFNFKGLPLAPLRVPVTTILTFLVPCFYTSSIVSCLCFQIDSNFLGYMLTCLSHP